MTGAREPSARGKCPACLRYFSLSKAGRLRVHSLKGDRRAVCSGSGQLPASAAP